MDLKRLFERRVVRSKTARVFLEVQKRTQSVYRPLLVSGQVVKVTSGSQVFSADEFERRMNELEEESKLQMQG